jgi:thiamine biosynthesis lipoprotein
VNLGGDVRVTGLGPSDEPWTVAVEHPRRSEPLCRVGLHDGAVATSTILKRRWTVDGQDRHHLIDPWTGQPSETDIELATIVAGTGWMAEVLAKAVLLRGQAHQFDIVGGTGAEALTVSSTGAVQWTGGLPAFLGGEQPRNRLTELVDQ